MRYLTDSAIADIPSLAGKDQGEIATILEDASRVYKYIKQNEGITDTELREYAQRNNYSPDQVTAALDVLRYQGRIYGFEDDVPLPSDE